MPLALGALLATLGTALQAGGVNPEIVIVARAILGLGTGFFLPGVPLYQAEIAPPSGRGIIVGLHGGFPSPQTKFRGPRFMLTRKQLLS
jgi:MFS family permease